MNFNRFHDQPLDAFASRFQRDGHLLLFHHIPKTAGSSLTRELSLTLPPYRNIHVGPDGHSIDRTQTDPMLPAVETFLADEPARRFGSASGHLRPKHLQMVREALPYASVFTVLRDPVARVISDYRYSSTPKHPPYKEFIERFPTMWKLVGGREATEEGITRIFNRYLFIGLVEDLTLHFEFLTGLLGCPKTIATRANVTQSSDSNKVELTDALRARIEAANAEDMAFYTAVAARLADKREEMVEFVAARRAEYLGQAASE